MGKSYTNYKQARQHFLKSAMEREVSRHFFNPSGKTKNPNPKPKKYPSVLTVQTVTGRMKAGPPEEEEELKPPMITVSIDSSQLTEAMEKVAESMSNGARIIGKALSQAALKGVSASISFSHSMSAVDALLQADRRFTVLQNLGWIRDPEGGLVSPHTLDIVNPTILRDEHDFELFLSVYLQTGKIADWVPTLYAVEKLALPLDSVRKQLERRIT
jgi:hypothetical protein